MLPPSGVTCYVTGNVTGCDTVSRVGRRREHDDGTRAALRAAAERLVAEGGPAALSVRAVAAEAGTTTRAVYSLFGSKEGLVVDALAQSAFEFLADGVDKLVETDDPVADLVAVGVPVFRTLVLEHPALYRIAFQRIVPGFRAGPEVTAARALAHAGLHAKIQRIEDAGLLGRKTVLEAAVEFNAMLEGLANAELRGSTLPILPPGSEERTWRDALTTVVRGFAASAPDRR
jgi:AcrR family transcriptional regulator